MNKVEKQRRKLCKIELNVRGARERYWALEVLRLEHHYVSDEALSMAEGRLLCLEARLRMEARKLITKGGAKE